ncbi:MAG: response regulator [Alphaproteobacteria bacterium]|nr:response regulator [Alphaproteobacteria bacterium]
MSVFQNNEAPTHDLSNITVLLVEDSQSMQSLLSSMLRAFGIGEVLACSGGKEAINLLTITQARKKGSDIHSIDMIVTDWLMPEGSGVELIDWIRSHDDDDIRFMPIILISAYTTEKVIITARDHGANETLVKPLSGQKLAKRVTSVINTPRPFIKTPTFFGPDRRRQTMVFAGDDRRKTKAEELKVHNEKL